MKILAFSGMVPEQICDTVRFTGYSERLGISHYCSYAAEFLARVLQDPDIDGAVFPRSCDSTRIMQSHLEHSGKFVFRMEIPVGQDDAAVAFLAEELQRYRRAVESHFGAEINDIGQRIERIEARNERLRGLYERLETLSYSEYLTMIHANLQRPLLEQSVPELPQRNRADGQNVFFVSSSLTDDGILRKIEACGLRIVGDNLPESRRLAFAPKLSDCSMSGIARSLLNNLPSPSRNHFERILKEDLAEIERKGIRGVIFLIRKFCEPYEFFYTVYRRALEARGIPSVKITLSGSEAEHAEVAIEAFADMIK